MYLFQIIVNGEEYHTYEHHKPVRTVRVLNITGDVDIRSIIFIAVRLLNPLRRKVTMYLFYHMINPTSL